MWMQIRTATKVAAVAAVILREIDIRAYLGTAQ
jgi:hypothetical protein